MKTPNELADFDLAAAPEAAALRTPPPRKRKILKKIGLSLAVLAGCYLLFRLTGTKLYYVPSEAMEPTLCGHDAGVDARGVNHSESCHDQIVVDRYSYLFRHPSYKDIIVFKAPEEADAEDKLKGLPQQEITLVKRIIGLPGDTIVMKNGAVYRNGQKLNEPYIMEPMRPELEPNFKYGANGTPVHLGPDQLWVMGDNRNDSNDSRYWGPLDRNRVIGKAVAIFAPVDHMRGL